MPHFRKWAEEYVGIDVTKVRAKQNDVSADPPHINHAFVKELGDRAFSRRSFEKWERIMHSHGHTMQEIYKLRWGKLDRCVDMVVYPDSTEHVEVRIVGGICL